jgi:hypothetical protein
MFRLIALYLHYRDLQEERARVGVHAAVPVMRVLPAKIVRTDDRGMVHALAA